MANKIITKENLTTNQFNVAFANSKMIQYWRANPVIACRDILGVVLLDYQAWLFTQTWFAKDSLWVLTRNGGKTIIASLYILLQSALFPEQEIFIASKSGRQSKKLFTYCEKLAMNKISEFGNLPDIYMQEIYRANESISGFSHDTAGFNVALLNGSTITTLNGIVENNLGQRATLVVFDEAGFCDEKIITSIEPYTTTEKSFITSNEEFFDYRTLPKNKPTQRLYISSASHKGSYFYKKFYDFSLRMMAGDNRFFAACLTVDTPLNPTLHGKKYAPLLSYSEVETLQSVNPMKCAREYYCRFEDGESDDQIIKASTIERNSTFVLPEITPKDNAKYIFGYDSAAIADNSILAMAKLLKDDSRGYYIQLANMVNFKDLGRAKGNRQMLYQDQLDEIRKYLVLYNGNNPEYQNIHKLAVDSGSGGGAHLYASSLFLNYKDPHDVEHRGIIDPIYYEDKRRDYPNAYPILRMVEPTKWKNVMIKRLVELMDLGLIEFPQEYGNSGYVDIEDSNGEVIRQYLSKEEELALINIDLCKEETKLIHRYTSASGNSIYKTREDMARTVHDDRFYTLCLIANELYEIREQDNLGKHKHKKEKDRTVLSLFN